MTQELIAQPKFDYDIENYIQSDMNNRLFCTFSSEETLEELLGVIQNKYTILYSKIFVLYAKSTEEYICTYNVDQVNITTFLDNTILVHRKKESKTLYTINSLNRLIESLNGGILDTSYQVNWNNYKNCILLTKGSELKVVNTKLYRIIDL